MRRTALLLVPLLVIGFALVVAESSRPALAYAGASVSIDPTPALLSTGGPELNALAPPNTGSGVESQATPGARTVIVVLGAGSALIGFVLLAVVANLGEPDPLPRRSNPRSDTQAPD